MVSKATRWGFDSSRPSSAALVAGASKTLTLHAPRAALVAVARARKALEATRMTAPNGQNSSSSEENDEGGNFDADAAAQQALAEAASRGTGESSEEDDDEEDGDAWDQDKARKKIDKANREARNLREQIKQLKPLAQEAEKARKDGQTEAQRLTEQKAELEVRIAEMEAADARRSAADQAGLSPQFVKFISAADPDEALTQAKELAKALKSATGEDKKPDLRQGNRGASNAGGAPSHDDLLRAMARGR